MKNEAKNFLWNGITEKDFLDESDNIIEEEIGRYDKEAMLYFIQNVNLMRHLPRLADSLKPVERRGLYALYNDKAFTGTKAIKSGVVVGHTLTWHPHGDSSIYGTLVGMSQPFTNPVPYIAGDGNFGNDENADGYAAMRYTEMLMSKYAQDCFFSDFDMDCIELIHNTSKDEGEPIALPCKYPNILVNGGFGIATGNQYCIPPYSIPDIIKITKKLLRNPDSNDIYMIPDIPTGCNIIDNGDLREICDTGHGTLKMRADISIIENPKKPNIWILRINNLPWMVNMRTVIDRLSALTKDGTLPIKDIENHSYPLKVKNPNGGNMLKRQIKVDVIINKAHDPNKIKQKLYKLTQLEKSLSVNFKVVTDALTVDILNMKGLVLAWITTRREYLRRKVNKKITKLTARKLLLEIMIVLTSEDNLEKTVKIIKNNDEANIVKALMENKQVEINSYQAEKIADMKLRAFSRDANKKYKKELDNVMNELRYYLNLTKDPKLINDIIDEQLDGLMKYHIGRKSKIISEETNIEISNTDHFVVITKLGMIKKLAYQHDTMLKRKTPSLGAFKNQDYPTHGLVINNLDSVFAFDHLGRFSCVPLHEIDSHEPSQYGSTIYDTLKLNGEIVDAYQFLSSDIQSFIKDTLDAEIFMVTLTADGYIKKTPITEFTKTRSQKNILAMNIRQGDSLVTGKIILQTRKDTRGIMIYTKKGYFSYISIDNIPLQSKTASGLATIKLDADDACKGIAIIGDMDEYILAVTEKGCMKRCELDYLGQPGKRKASSYLATLDPTDAIAYVDTIESDTEITVCTRTSYQTFNSEDIPIKGRKAKCAKMISIPLGNSIISVGVSKVVNR